MLFVFCTLIFSVFLWPIPRCLLRWLEGQHFINPMEAEENNLGEDEVQENLVKLDITLPINLLFIIKDTPNRKLINNKVGFINGDSQAIEDEILKIK